MENSTTQRTSREAGHETSDANVRGVWFTGLGLALCTILIMGLVVLMFDLLLHRHEALDEAEASQNVSTPIAASVAAFPGPRLQVAPEVDLAAFRAREEAELDNYGWIDRKAGVVRLPIERAMDLIVERGLPVSGQPGAPPPTRTVLDMQQARPSDWAKQKQQGQGNRQVEQSKPYATPAQSTQFPASETTQPTPAPPTQPGAMQPGQLK
jgi:hypothetical protein